MQTRAAAGIHSTQPNLSRQNIERPMHLAFVQSVAVFVHQEMSFASRTKAAVPTFRIIGQDLAGCSMQRYQTRLSKLGSSNRENAFRPIHVPDSEVERLT